MCAAVRISEQSGIYSALKSLHFLMSGYKNKHIPEIVFAIIVNQGCCFKVLICVMLFFYV